MSNKTNYLEDAIIQFFYRNDADGFTPPSTIYVALFTAVADAEAGSVTEVSTAGGYYARVSCAFDDPSGTGVTANTSAVTFGKNLGSSLGTVTHFGTADAATSGNFYHIGELDDSFVYGTNVTPAFASGELDLTED